MNSRELGKRLTTMLAVITFSASCAGQLGSFEQPAALASAALTAGSPVPSSPVHAAQIYRESGIASWYGKEFHGRKTAGGESFDMYGISAAHRTLPLGTVIRVTNLDNYKSITLKVNDRGPFVINRVIELSYGAARELDFVARGTIAVKIETIDVLDTTASYAVQAAMFTEEESAKALKARLSQRFELISIVPYESNLGISYRVRVGSYRTEEKAELVASRLKLEGLEPIVVRKD